MQKPYYKFNIGVKQILQALQKPYYVSTRVKTLKHIKNKSEKECELNEEENSLKEEDEKRKRKEEERKNKEEDEQRKMKEEEKNEIGRGRGKIGLNS